MVSWNDYMKIYLLSARFDLECDVSGWIYVLEG